jgi:phage terminase large subunit-like protein
MPEADLPIDPYVLGAWLGDGSKDSARFASSREDFQHFAGEVQIVGHSVHVYEERENTLLYQIDKRDRAKICRRGHDMESVGRDSCGRCKACNADRSAPYTVDGLSWRLRRLGLLGNKNVPDLYLMASEGQRMALLQGLMDADGCCSSADGQAIFANTNERLSEAVHFLAASLGMKPSIKRRERDYRGAPHVMWWVTFQTHSDRPPFRMSRKIANCSTAVDHPRRRRRVVSEVERVESRQVSCIQVDNEDGCYLVGKALITTHNSTVEAWGLVDGQPTGKHYKRRIYDDVVVPASVTTPEMIAKTTEMWELSDNLSSEGGAFRIAGTRYHFNDTYGEMLRRGVVTARVYPATIDGTETGEPVLMSRETLAAKRRTQGPYTYSCQMLLNPRGDETQGFHRNWLSYAKGEPHGRGLNKYIIVDPANSKKKNSDWTAIGVIGLGPDRNYVLLDLVRDKLNLRERAEALLDLHEKWLPLGVGYEEYGLQADIQFIEHIQEERNYRFRITPLGGSMSKVDRIRRLIPLFEQGRFYLPKTIWRTLYDKTTVNLIDVFVEEEFAAFPVSVHDDMLDMLSRIEDEALNTVWPLSDEAKLRGAKSRPTHANVGYAHMKRRRH